jgi:hypothetical protein
MLLLVPLTAVLCVEPNVLVSSRASGAGTAPQLGALAALPIGVLYVGGQIALVKLDARNLAVISAVEPAAGVAPSHLSPAVLSRQETLTRREVTSLRAPQPARQVMDLQGADPSVGER